MAAYLIARIEVLDPEGYAEYARQTVASAEPYGGRFLVKGGPSRQVEGEGPARIAVIEFPDMERLEAWYASDEYQAILPIALKCSRRDIVFVEGI